MPAWCTAQIISCVSEGRRDLNVKQTSYILTMIMFALEKAIQICLDALLASFWAWMLCADSFSWSKSLFLTCQQRHRLLPFRAQRKRRLFYWAADWLAMDIFLGFVFASSTSNLRFNLFIQCLAASAVHFQNKQVKCIHCLLFAINHQWLHCEIIYPIWFNISNGWL